MKINKANLKQFRIDFNQIKKDLEQKHNCKISLGDISFSDEQFTTKMTVRDAEISKSDFERREFERYAPMYGVDKTDYLRVVTINSVDYHFIAFNTRSPKNNATIEAVRGGKRYKCSLNAFKKQLTQLS